MEGDRIHIQRSLLPLSWLYGMAVGLRGWLYDVGLLKSQTYAEKLICVGNLTVGGTGKTPHTEYLLRLLLQKGKRVAVLSRGYKRKSRGYQVATPSTPMSVVGDEPWQMKHKFPEATVAVDADRRRGLRHLFATSRPDVTLLDDAFQHRRVRAGLSIVLIDYHRMATDDRLLPAGRLREGLSALERTQMVVVSKCPRDLTPMDFRCLQKALNLRPYQKLFFSTLRYGQLSPLYGRKRRALETLKGQHVLLLTGIAAPEQLLCDLQPYGPHLTSLSFGDHHRFTPRDLARVAEAYAALPHPSLILTTEKDAARLLALSLPEAVKRAIYALPVEVEFLREEAAAFEEAILDYINA